MNWAARAANMYARSSIHYGQWAGSYVHGDLDDDARVGRRLCCATSKRGRTSPEAGVAHRVYGVTQWFAGDFVEARAHLEQAVAIFDPERDRDLAFRFGQDVGVVGDGLIRRSCCGRSARSNARECLSTRRPRQYRGIGTPRDLDVRVDARVLCSRFMRPQMSDRAAPLAKALVQLSRATSRSPCGSVYGAFLGGLGGIDDPAPRKCGLAESATEPPPCFNGMASGPFDPLIKTISGGSGSTEAGEVGSRSGHYRAGA